MRDLQAILNQMTLEEKANFVSGRDFWHTRAIPRLNVPAVMMCDGPNGLRKQEGEGDHLGINKSIETVCYPTASAMASSFDVELMQTLGEYLGRECQAEDVAMLLGPGVNMKRSPLCGRNFEYFSEDPVQAGKMGAAYIRGLQVQGVSACVKHFACNDQETRRMSGSSQVDERTLREIYLPAFEMAVKEGKTGSVMNAYNAINGTFCAENKELLTGILRDEWGFDGFVVTDWGAIKDRAKGLEAGVDLEMPGAPEGKSAGILKALEEGRLTMEALDKAVLNLLKFVFNFVDQRKENASFDREEARIFSAQAAAQCAVLLKNESVLPLAENQKVVFIGRYAKAPRYQGAGSSHINVPKVVGAMDCVDGLNVTWVSDEDAEAAVKAAKEADAAVIFTGLPESFESEGADREHMRMPEEQNALVKAVCATQIKTIVVLHGGSAMELPWKDEVAAILLMHLGGDGVGKATVELLYGRENPSGHLAETWPLRLEDTPAYFNFPGEEGIVEYREGQFIGYRYYDKKKLPVAFPFGHGLSYTTFAYSDLKLSTDTVTNTENLTVCCTVKNAGTRKGSEVVQLYLGALGGANIRPVRALKAFAKVALEPGEEKTVSFTLSPRDFAIWSVKIHDWFVESGKYCVAVGSSSRDLRLSTEITMNSAQELPLHYDRFSVVADLQKTAKGRAMLGQIMAARKQSRNEDIEKEHMQNLGEGSEKMMQNMMLEMPLGAFVSYGVMNDEALDAFIAALNE